jgi:hypothetical protein
MNWIRKQYLDEFYASRGEAGTTWEPSKPEKEKK